MKKFLSSLIIITTLILNVNTCNVYAVGTSTGVASGMMVLKTAIDIYVDIASPTAQQTIQLMSDMLNSGGFINDLPNYSSIGSIINYMATQIDSNQANLTEQENIECIKEAVENIDTSGDTITISDSFKTALINTANYFENETQSYVYTYTLTEIASKVNLTAVYLALQDKIPQAGDTLNKVYLVLLSGTNSEVVTIDQYSYPYVYARVLNTGTGIYNGYSFFQIINGLNNTSYTIEGSRYDSTTQKFTKAGNNFTSQFCVGLNESYTTSQELPTSGYSYVLVSNHSRIPIRLVQGNATPNDILYQPYYYNREVWQDFSSSSGDYTYDASNVNTVSYGDVTTYIDSYNQENGSPPSPINIQIEIKNQDNDNKDDSGGGSSGSGGDDSGDDDPTDIFGWLKQLGKVLGDLIKGLGEFLTEVVTGLVSALTNLLSGIADLISNITETLPSAFMDWFSSLFEWMPDEWVALLSASLVFMVLWGIIKVIRG